MTSKLYTLSIIRRYLFPFKKRFFFFVLQFLFVVFLFITHVSALQADESDPAHDAVEHPWFLTVYTGAHWQEQLRDIFFFRAEFKEDSYLATIALGKELWRYKDWIGFEIEGQVTKHFGRMHHWELNALIILRWHLFPWDKYIDTSLAVGDGISYATERPVLEKKPEAGHTMNYLMYELTFGLPDYPDWALVVRVHHRSSIYGLIDEDYGSSNFFCTGIKYYF